MQSQSPNSPDDQQLHLASFDPTQVQQVAKGDLDFFASLALPEIYKYAFPPIYIQFWALIVSILHKRRDFSQFALGLPRGFAKTLVIKLLILYAILFTEKRFILVVCENEEKGKSILADVASMLSEPNIINVFGDWKQHAEQDTLTKKKFSFRGKDIVLKVAGAGTGIRGISENNLRPDFMIFDDIQSREASESELISKQLETWMTGTAMKAKSPEGCTFLFVANMYPTKGSLLRKLKGYTNWIKFIVGGILSDGTSLWEQLQPIEQLLREFRNDLASGQPQIFYSEVLNDENASVNSAFDLSAIPPYPYTPEELYSGSFIVIDPSNDKLTSDGVGIGGFLLIDSRPVCREILEQKLSPGDTIREALKMAFKLGASVIAIESNAYQYSLKYWTEIILQQLGVTGIHVVELYSGQRSKQSRILEMFKQLVPPKDGAPIPDIVLHPETRGLIDAQIVSFNPLKRDNSDNILDVLTYAPKVIELYGPLIALNEHRYEGELETEMLPESDTSAF